MKSVKYGKNYHNLTEVSKCCWKMVPVDLLGDAGLPLTFNVLKMQYLWSTVNTTQKWTPKRGMPIDNHIILD